jgi:hypothetical protein
MQRSHQMTQPLRSCSLSQALNTTTGCSVPVPLIGTFRLARSACLTFSLNIATTGSHVPRKSLNHSHAALIPDAAWPGRRLPPSFLSRLGHGPDSDIFIVDFRYVISSSLSLVSVNLTERTCVPVLASTLTTTTLDRSSLRWFEISSYQPTSGSQPHLSRSIVTSQSEAPFMTHYPKPTPDPSRRPYRAQIAVPKGSARSGTCVWKSSSLENDGVS